MEAELKAIFKLADKDGNGTLSPEEIRTQLLSPSPNKKITEKEVEIALKELDLDSDGKVSCQGKFLTEKKIGKFFNFFMVLKFLQSSLKSSQKYFQKYFEAFRMK